MKRRIKVPATWEQIDRLMAFVDEIERRTRFSDEQCYLLRLVIEEIATNIIKYGYANRTPGPIDIACAEEAGTLRITIRDRGQPFDPRDAPAPNFGGDPRDREPGGLGLFLIRELADQIGYRHNPRSSWNELTIVKGP